VRASDHVSFDGEYNTEHTPSEPAGKEIVSYLAQAFVADGLNLLSTYQTDYSHGLMLSLDGAKFYVEVGMVGDKDANWLAYFGLRSDILGIKKRIFSSRYNAIANTLNIALHNNKRISNIRWYKDQSTWNFSSENYTLRP
jgi:hypothetical protein